MKELLNYLKEEPKQALKDVLAVVLYICRLLCFVVVVCDLTGMFCGT